MIDIDKYNAGKQAGTATLSALLATFPEAARVVATYVAYDETGKRADRVEYMTLANYQQLAAFVAEVEVLP